MVGSKSFALVAASALLEVASAVPWTNKRQTVGGNTNACAALSEVYESTSVTNLPVVAPSDAYACLRSIPVDADRNAALLTWMAPYMEFQSTVGILADPPAGYMFPGVDILGGFRNMTRMLQNGEYDNQYDFVIDLYRIINVKSREGHLSYFPSLISAVQFETPVLFISISEDGLKLPEVYVYQDYIAGVTSNYVPSAVESFDGLPVADWLEQRSVSNAPAQDPDASYNMQLWSAPLENIGATARPMRFFHEALNDTSVLVFANGTELDVPNYAILQGDWSGLTSGLDVHRRFEIPGRTGSAASDPLVEQRGNGFELPDLIGYPEPYLKHSDNYLSAYLFDADDESLANTAVIAVKSFMSSDPQAEIMEDIVEFTQVVNSFVADSATAGAERLIIDFQGNGGGAIGNLIGLYNVLFPENDLFLHMRARANDVLDWIGTNAESSGVDIPEFYPYDTSGLLDENLEPFDSWKDFYELDEILGDEFGQLFQTADLVRLTALPERFSWARHPAYFVPNNTVIVTDGYCASACAMAVGLMSRLLGINTVAMGGRPIEGPMQAIGGTKGGPVMPLATAQEVFGKIADVTAPPASLDATPFYSYPPLAGPPASTFVINTANVHLHNDLKGTPAQFVYEAANCKLFYTWETLTNMTLLWQAVADVEWNGAKCVRGSTGNSDDTMAQSVPAFSQDVVSRRTWVSGPGDVSDRPPVGEPPSSGGGGGNGGTRNDNGSAAASVRAGLGTLAAAAFAGMAAMFLV